jgi:hypothetical protein
MLPRHRGNTEGATMRWFILVVALLLDPAAVLLLLAATHGGADDHARAQFGQARPAHRP